MPSFPRILLLGAAATALLATPAGAATITVANTHDSGPGSLRQALTSAKIGDTVSVPAGTYVLTSGQLSVPDAVTVRGAGARSTTISGNSASRVVQVAGIEVTLADLTIRDGSALYGAGVATGLGVSLSRVALRDNVASTYGGGLSAEGNTEVHIDDSLIAGNQAGHGGGVFLTSGDGAHITDSTVTGNVATTADSGGIANGSGGLALFGDTIVGNSAVTQGGNLRMATGSSTYMRDTVLGAGTAADGGNCYLSGGAGFSSLGHNAQDADAHPNAACQSHFGATDRSGLALGLGALGDHGGPLATMVPQPGSPLLDKADAASCLPADVRGVPRPQGGGCDVGAVERSTPTASPVVASALTTTAATLRASARSLGLGGSARIAYGPTTGYGASTAPVVLPAAVAPQAVTASPAGLTPGTTYHARLQVTTPDGTATGPDVTFTTAKAAAATPAPRTAPATVTLSGAKATRRGARVRLSCHGTAGQACRGTATLRAGRRTLGRKAFTVGAGRAKVLRVKLGRKGRTRLKRRGHVSVRLRVRLKGAHHTSRSKALTIRK